MKDLDISETLVPSWEVCIELTKHLNRLELLTVSNNRWPISLENPETEKVMSSLSTSLPNLKELVVGKMNYDWNDVALLASSLPNLR